MRHRLQTMLLPATASPSQPGIYSVCSAHPWVLQAAAEQALEDQSLLLIEATSNQVNQDGGYTGMRPSEFRQFVENIAQMAGLPGDRLVLGGDHLGPNPWRHLPAAEAMERAGAMVTEYSAAGFTKIHLDASMSCSDDPDVLSDEQVASRAVEMALKAEQAIPANAAERPVYVIGTEVPTPGGATHALDDLQVTKPSAAEHTLEVHRRAFIDRGLEDAWSRVLALVLQPGVEFAHDSVVDYEPDKAKLLQQWLHPADRLLVFEAHSTDYQRPAAYRELVRDGFAILKVGPALTFALREALFALEEIERQLVPPTSASSLAATVEAEMLRAPAEWNKHYSGTEAELHYLRVYSYSDRMRYFWNAPQIQAAVTKLIQNLSPLTIPLPMLSRYLPEQYARVRQGVLSNEAKRIAVDKVRDVLRVYAAACSAQG